jgi:hypothetical protein
MARPSKAVVVHPAVCSRLVYLRLYHILICHYAPPYLSYTRRLTSLISPAAGFDTLVLSLYFGPVPPTLIIP